MQKKEKYIKILTNYDFYNNTPFKGVTNSS